MQILNCPICLEELYSKEGFGCRMCGMPLQESDIDFCCDNCEKMYYEVNENE